LTRLGRVLEATSLNEIPQLWSVVRGDLSLVGPRPPLASEVLVGRAPIPAVRPGVTGLWKTEDRSPALDDHIRLDRFYVDNWSFALDLVVLAATMEPILARIVYGASERRQAHVDSTALAGAGGMAVPAGPSVREPLQA
jgi:lipopolysaccharide/colanic/teichoic acid biosynthesis glycosyltransferase